MIRCGKQMASVVDDHDDGDADDEDNSDSEDCAFCNDLPRFNSDYPHTIRLAPNAAEKH